MNTANKYCPQNLGEVIFPNKTVENRIKAYASGQLSGDLLLWGTNGTCKTTVANMLPNLIGGNNPFIESDFNNLIKQSDLYGFLLQASHNASFFNSSSIIFLVFHEFDDAKGTMSNLWKALDQLNQFERKSMLIVTTNHPMKIHTSLLSRFVDIEFPNVTVSDFIARAQYILNQEGVSLPNQQVVGILKAVESYGNIRKYCQKLDEIIYLHNNNLPIPYPASKPSKPVLKIV